MKKIKTHIVTISVTKTCILRMLVPAKGKEKERKEQAAQPRMRGFDSP